MKNLSTRKGLVGLGLAFVLAAPMASGAPLDKGDPKKGVPAPVPPAPAPAPIFFCR